MDKLDKYDIEEIILGMADIVKENRDLRYEIKRMEAIHKRQIEDMEDFITDLRKADNELLKIAMERVLMGGGEK